jgi:putative tricarboxylic transport membrane protein
LGLSCIALLFEHVIVQTRRNADVSSTETRNADGGLTGTAVLTLCLLTGYYLLLERLGFILSTGLFLLAFLSFTNHRRWLVNLAVATLFPIAAYVLLATLLGARLPVGILAMG